MKYLWYAPGGRVRRLSRRTAWQATRSDPRPRDPQKHLQRRNRIVFPGVKSARDEDAGRRDLAEDLVQDAFVRLAGRLLHLRNRAGFDA
jgi:hypothetical protein